MAKETWTWKNYGDSGVLVAPDGKEYFSYDAYTREYKITPEDRYEYGFSKGEAEEYIRQKFPDAEIEFTTKKIDLDADYESDFTDENEAKDSLPDFSDVDATMELAADKTGWNEIDEKEWADDVREAEEADKMRAELEVKRILDTSSLMHQVDFIDWFNKNKSDRTLPLDDYKVAKKLMDAFIDANSPIGDEKVHIVEFTNGKFGYQKELPYISDEKYLYACSADKFLQWAYEELRDKTKVYERETDKNYRSLSEENKANSNIRIMLQDKDTLEYILGMIDENELLKRQGMGNLSFEKDASTNTFAQEAQFFDEQHNVEEENIADMLDKHIEAIQVNGGLGEAVIEADYEAEQARLAEQDAEPEWTDADIAQGEYVGALTEAWEKYRKQHGLIKASEIETWATGNGFPAHGDEIITDIDGILYRTEFYAEDRFNTGISLNIAADATIEKFSNGQWVEINFPNTSKGDDMYNNLLDKITPKVIDEYNDIPTKEFEEEFSKKYYAEKTHEKDNGHVDPMESLERFMNGTDEERTEMAKEFHEQIEERQIEHDKQNLKYAGNVLVSGDSITVINEHVGEIYVDSGNVGKSGNGLQHMIEQRFEKDGKSVDEITALLGLVIDSASNGTVARDTKIIQNDQDIGTYDLEKNGIIAFVSKTRDGKDEKFVITGFDDFSKKEQATGAIKTVIANNSYDSDFVIVKNQTVAVLASAYNLHLQDLNVNMEKAKNATNIGTKKQFTNKVEKLEKVIEKYNSNDDIKEAVQKVNENNKELFTSLKNNFGYDVTQLKIVPNFTPQQTPQETLQQKYEDLDYKVTKHCTITVGDKKYELANGLLDGYCDARQELDKWQSMTPKDLRKLANEMEKRNNKNIER